jgi:hypothetical protein
MRQTSPLLLSLGLMMACVPAMAQSPSATPPAATTPAAPAQGSADCTPSQAAPDQGTITSGATTGQSREPLGDRLARSDGVLCPPSGVDPEIRAPTPKTGNMPVIPPPGSPGGDPSQRPK